MEDNKSKCNCSGSEEGCSCSKSDSKSSGGCKSGCSCSDNTIKKARPEILDLLKTDLL